MLTIETTVLVVVDMQERLLASMPDRAGLADQVSRLARGCVELEVPILLTEQIPSKLGPTDPSVLSACAGARPIAKSCFSCAGEPEFMRALAALARRDVVLCGIETHVCVAQTARDLLAAGYGVEIAGDAVASRAEENRRIALDRLAREGARLTSVEMVLFELLRVAGDDRFRAILKIVK